jgi:hypothetical protein
MACPWVVDGGDGLQIWRATENILDKQLLRAEPAEVSPPDLGFCIGLATSQYKKNSILWNVTQGLGLVWVLWNYILKKKWK